MSSKDYIPKNDDALLKWAKKLAEYADEQRNAQWRVPPAAEWVAKTADDFERKLAKAQDVNRGKVDTLRKNDAKTALKKVCREYIQGFLAKNPLLNNDDREEMGLPIYDTVASNIPAPHIQVSAEVHCPGKGLVELKNIRAIGERPDNRADYGVRIYYGILGEPSEKDRFRISAPPKTGDDLPHSIFTRQKKHLFDFVGDSGRQAFFCMRYENSKGQVGPWGDILETFIS